MTSKAGRSSEHDIAYAAMKYLASLPMGTATTATVKKHIPNFIKLTPGDNEPSDTRPNEEVWRQVVGNIVSHRLESPENFINRGLIDYTGGKWSLTAAGRAFLAKHGV
ncbi:MULTISPECIES: hypothetical protein [unclassified Sphingopyxis]|uniref:hypothetical protein n=1 Tax=unclassified Sphingopyxis TaxID=2614943 RepID=UPI00285DAAE2|nr:MULTISPECIES: hypothetical protein [unclassified Sphingopyxis]MDR7058591.1 hypothetical protein [Sphingopyxis sp. BE235]MDR7179223.1 hypothetical protein [Sphingopyxis sp. BE249]